MAEPPKKPSLDGLPAVPDLGPVRRTVSSQHMPAVRPSQNMPAVRPSQNMPAVRPSQHMPAVRPSQNMPAVQAPPAITIDDDDDDDPFGMQIQRNLGTADLPIATSSRAAPAAISTRPARVSSGLELDGSRKDRYVHEEQEYEPSTVSKLVGFVVAMIVLGGVAFALVRFAHRAHGIKVTALLPHAFDGSSAAQSGIVSGVAIVLAVAFGFLGLKTTPRSWPLVGSAVASMLVALAMVTVTLASTGEGGAPPDGALLVPYLAPLVIAGISLTLGGRAAWLFADRKLGRKLLFLPVAALGGAVMYLAYETSKLGTG